MQTATTHEAAVRIIGRRPCPWCGFAHSHVKQKGDGKPYHYCPECGAKTLTRNANLARLITNGMRPEPNYAAVPQLARRADDIVLSPAAVAELRRPGSAWDVMLSAFGVFLPTDQQDHTMDHTNTNTAIEQLREAAQSIDTNTLHLADLARGLVAAIAVIEEQHAAIEQLRNIVGVGE